MPSPRNAQIIAVILASSFLFGTPFRAARAQDKPQSPAQVAPQTPPQLAEAGKQKPDYSTEAAVIEQLATTYRFERDGTGRRELSMRVKVQSEAGVERFGQLVFPYTSANEKLDMDFVRVRKADGSVVNATAADVQDLSAPLAREAPIYTDLRQKHITVPGLRPGDTLEYRFVWNIQSPLAQNHFWVEHDFVTRGPIVLDDQLTVNIPAASKVKLKTEQGYEPTIKEENDRRVYTWKKAKLKRDSDDDEKEKEKQEEEEVEPKDLDEIRPQVQLTTFQSWDEVGQWYAGLQRDRVVPDEKIKTKAEEIIKGYSTERDKVTALYEYVAKNFRYVSLSFGQGRYQPHAATDVMSNQYGDCKDKHTLLASMLAATGLRAYPVLINSARKLDVDIPSPGQFDHVISAIPLGNETLWADTTAEVAPAGLLSPRLRNKQALMVPTAGPAHLETTPAAPPFLSSEVITLEGTIDDLGKITGRGRMVLRGDSEMYMRFMFRRTPKSDWKRLGFYLGMAAGLTAAEVTDIKASDPADLAKPFEVEFNVSRKDFLDWSTKKLKVALPFPSFRLVNFYGRTSKSKKPLEIGPPTDVSYSLKLTLPAKYQTRLPLSLKVSRDYGDYSASYKLEGQTLTGERTLHLRQSELPPERLQDYQAFVAAVTSDAAQTLLMETEVAGAPVISDSVKTDELLQSAAVAIKNENYEVAVQLLKRVVQKDPKNKSVRRDLGFVLIEQQEMSEAIEVLREQTKINPFDDSAYNLLGRAYWGQQDYANAEQAFRKQLEVSPLDQTALSNLGRMLVEARKYKEAIPELERTISLSSDDEDVYVTLGNALLNVGETQKALKAFEEALKIDRGPGTLNDVAYFLANKGTELDKALEYAESAVAAIANDLRSVQASNLTMDDLDDVSWLAAYWDTLGWVHFQKGNLDLAEKYIKAAWHVYQVSDVAYHLGMIAEKRGKKEEAIRLYAQGAVAIRPIPETRESLARLAPANSVEKLLQTAKGELDQYNTFSLAQQPIVSVRVAMEAEFYLIFAPDTTRRARAVDVKFISGNEHLRQLTTQLKTIKYQLVFPDASPTKIVRRGIVRCAAKPGTPCTLTMISPEMVTSLD